MKKIVLLAYVLLLLLTAFGTCFSPIMATNPETTLYVNPAIIEASPGENFTVGIEITNVEDLWDYEFRLSWDPALLDLTDVSEGSFLNAEETYSTFFVKKEDFPSVGNLYVVCTLMGEPVSAAASGGGTLATVEFQVLDAGNCTLDLYGTFFEGPPPEQLKIEHAIEDGFFIIPEFPAWTSMLLILIVLAVATVIYKRRLPKAPIYYRARA